jgi:hypothetical protein
MFATQKAGSNPSRISFRRWLKLNYNSRPAGRAQ